MVVQPGESNAMDQRILEYTLWHEHAIPLVRRTLAQIEQHHTRDERGQLLLDSGRHRVAIVYFRAGYSPRDYPSELEYAAVKSVERSVAIKCPSLLTHLAGTKKIQQVLAEPGQLERFISAEKADRLRQCFAGLYAIEKDDEEVRAAATCRQDDKRSVAFRCSLSFLPASLSSPLSSLPQTRSLIRSVLASPSSYVLKPQREGGGNNLWNSEMVAALKRMTPAERAAFIIMRKIEVEQTNGDVIQRAYATTKL